MTKVTWRPSRKEKDKLYFYDLEVGDSFKNSSRQGKGAVYIKVQVMHTSGQPAEVYEEFTNEECFGHSYGMMEVATGKIYPPTVAEVKKVDVEIVIGEHRPRFYKEKGIG